MNDNLAASSTYVVLFMEHYTDFKLSYYSLNPDEELPEVTFSSEAPVPNSWSFYFPLADSESSAELAESDEVAEMGVWPASDSVQVIGDTIVIKLSETEDD